jgi:hypothetical protein
MNIQEIKNYIQNLTFENFFQIDNDFFIIDLDYLTNRDYQSQGVNELIYIAGQNSNKIFIFLIRDGVNIFLSGLSDVINHIVKNLNLSKERCYIYGYADPEIPNTTFIDFDVIQMWCSMIHKEIENLPLATPNLLKKFSLLVGRHDLYRLKLVKYLYENYKQESLVSYNSNIAIWNYRFSESFFAEDKQWYQKNCPILLDFENPQGWVPFQQSLATIHNHYQDYLLEIVCETDPHSNKFFTEKTLKNFYLGKPFIIFAGSGSLKYLQSKGFLTFAPFINESYDDINCPYQRLESIFAEIDRISKLTSAEIYDLLGQLEMVFRHNRQNFLKFV